MKTITETILIVILIIPGALRGQSLERFTIDFAGGIAQTNQLQVQYAVGQPFVQTIEAKELVISEGFVQGMVEEVSTSIRLQPQIKMVVHPNPTVNFISMRSSEMLPHSKVSVWDGGGRLIAERPFAQNMQIDLQQLGAGTYILLWCDQQNRLVRKFRIVKL